MPKLILALLALAALSSCASPGERLVDMERCASTVPTNADDDGKERAMKRCMRGKGYGLEF
jgi:hypothetical protein